MVMIKTLMRLKLDLKKVIFTNLITLIVLEMVELKQLLILILETSNLRFNIVL